jgi:DNA polymerase/3'-5' exonuclease PolX
MHTTKVKQEKIQNLLFKTEKDIFDFLCMEYIEPQDRHDEHSVILTLHIEDIKKHIQEKIDAKPAQEPTQEPAIPATTANKETLKIKMSSSKAHTLKKFTKKIKETILENLNKFKSQGITALAILSLEELTAMLQEAIDNYYISELKENTLLTDNEYDILR